MSDNKTAVALLGALGLLTALLTAFATANNGIGRIELNERLLLLIGTWLVLLALVMGGIYFAVKSKGHTIILIAGMAFLGAGLGFASYAAVTHVSGRPAITAKLQTDKNLGVLVSGAVSVSDIPSSTHLELRVIALIPGQVQGKTKLVGTPIYSAAFGPNSAGDVEQTYQVILPEKVLQVLIKAWTGAPGHCFSSEIPKGRSQAKIKNNLGCLRMRVPPRMTAQAPK